MRHIQRDKMEVPTILSDKRVSRELHAISQFISQVQEKGGTRRAPRSEWFDNDWRVRHAFESAFGGCCAYCEKRAPSELERNGENASSGLIGRHRPRMLAQDERGNTDLLSYVWLAYDWENLLWICKTCARNKKNNFFVHEGRGQPFMSITELREMEQERLIDPCIDDPEQHLAFNIDGQITALTELGKDTIDLLDLASPNLTASRVHTIRTIANWIASGDLKFDGGFFAHKYFHTRLAHTGAATSAFKAFLGYTQFRDFSRYLIQLSGPEAFELATKIHEASGHELIGNEPTELLQFDHKFSVATAQSVLPRRNRVPNIKALPNALAPISHVRISNFKGLKDIEFSLPEHPASDAQVPCMLLLGENAVGKSSVLEAMALATIGSAEAAKLNTALDTEGLSPADLIHRPDPYLWNETADKMAVRMEFQDGDESAELIAEAGDQTFYGTSYCSKIVLAYGPRRYFTNRKTRRLRAPAHRVRSLFDPMDMIANPILWLNELEEKQFFAAARALREVLMLSEEDDFERDDDPETPGQIYIRQKDQRTAMKDLSVGYKSVIALVCDIIRELLYHYDNIEFASAVVYIDEIETHLHPRWKMRIISLLRRAFPKVQFIATTHDPLCLRGMNDGEVFVLQRGDDDTVEQVTELPSIRGMRAEQILTSEFFGLGSTDPETEARLARYNLLAARKEKLDVDEEDELERLRKVLDDDMVLGTSLIEQAYVEALKKEVVASETKPTKAPSPRRETLRSTFSILFEDKAR
nr:AAA family ATPase [uncultured Cohaesibacter sp.]